MLGVWTEKQKSLEQNRNQCLRKMMVLFNQVTCFLFPRPSVLQEKMRVVISENNIYLEIHCILVTWGYYNKLHGLKQQKCILLEFRRPVYKIKMEKELRWFFLKALRNVFHVMSFSKSLIALDNRWHSLACSCITPLLCFHFSPFPSLSVFISESYKVMCHGFRTHLFNPR